MIQDIEDKKVNCVIVKDLSRFGRDYIETGRYLEKYFPGKGVRFISLTDDIDSGEKSYDLLLPLKNIFNEQYARDISVKIHAALKAKQEAGEFVGAFACYGYRKCPGARNRLAPDPYAAGIVRRIFLLYAGGMSKSEIAETLNRESVPSPSAYKRLKGENYCNPGEIPGRGWTYSAVHQILCNETYTGTMVQGKKTQKMRGRQRAVPRSDWIRVENTHEPLIDRELWETVQEQMTVNRRSYSAVSERNVFAGLARCGICGSSMIRNSWRRADGSSAAVLYCGTYKRNGLAFCSPHRTDFRILEEAVKADLYTLLDCAGLLCSALLWRQFQTPLSLLPGLLLQLLALTIALSLRGFSRVPDRIQHWRRWLRHNLWVLLPIPILWGSSLLFSMLPFSYWGPAPFVAALICYLVVVPLSVRQLH